MLWELLPSSVMDITIKEHHMCIRRLLQKHNGYESATGECGRQPPYGHGACGLPACKHALSRARTPRWRSAWHGMLYRDPACLLDCALCCLLRAQRGTPSC